MTAVVAGTGASDRYRQSEQTRRANLARLHDVRNQAYEDLMGTLAWVRELVSMIHLAKFTGAPASRAEELVAQIAAAIEGISAVTWQERGSESSGRPQGAGFHPSKFPQGACSMRLFQRIGDIIAANLNDLVDRFEDPEVMLKQAIREMETMIAEATGGAARAIAGERLLARELADHEQKAARWRARAEEAVSRGDDDLARQAICRAHEHEAMAQRSPGSARRPSRRRRPFAVKWPRCGPSRPRHSASWRPSPHDARLPGPAEPAMRWLVEARAERMAFCGLRECTARSSRPKRKPKRWESSTKVRNRAWRRISSRVSEPAASRPSLTRSRSGWGRPGRLAVRMRKRCEASIDPAVCDGRSIRTTRSIQANQGVGAHGAHTRRWFAARVRPVGE